MGFFGDLGKAFMGKPLGPQAENQPESLNTAQADNGILDERGLKIIPDIEVKKLDSDRVGDDKLIVRAWIQNNSDQELRIEWTSLLKQKITQNQFIGPRDSREVKLYDGKIPDNENERTAQIAFKLTKNNDLFMESYRIDYGIEPDGKRIIEQLHSNGPARDI